LDHYCCDYYEIASQHLFPSSGAFIFGQDIELIMQESSSL